MATQYDPIAKDGSLNTTEATPRNIADVLAEGLKGIEDALPPSYTEGDGIDISNNEISVDTTFTEASTRANIASGESFSTILGKIKKFFSDLKTVAFTGAYSDLSGTPDLTNVAVKNANNRFSANQTIDDASGTTTTTGITGLTLGNNKASGTAGNTRGSLQIYGSGSYSANVQATNMTANRTHQLPDASGTIALTSDVDAVLPKTISSISGSANTTYKFATEASTFYCLMTHQPYYAYSGLFYISRFGLSACQIQEIKSDPSVTLSYDTSTGELVVTLGGQQRFLTLVKVAKTS